MGIDGIDQWGTFVTDAPNLRDELLLNIDDIQGNSAIISGGYKLIVGNNTFDDWYGESGRGGGSPVYTADNVISSKAGVALSKISGKLTSEDIQKLRSGAEIQCNVKEEQKVKKSRMTFFFFHDYDKNLNI